jgi:serpin B
MMGCTAATEADLMEGVTPRSVTALADLDGGKEAITDFALRLFTAANEGEENTALSPLSVLCLLSMVANGARGETLAQMEEAFGMTKDEMNLYLYSYVNSLPQGKSSYTLNVANSLWLSEGSVKSDFLQANADYHGAGIFRAPMNEETRTRINDWVKEKTDGMIPTLLDDISESARLYAINALAFEATWKNQYDADLVLDGIFTKEDGTELAAKLMYSTEGKFLQSENATGFLKYYSGEKYAFVALLPEEGTSVADMLSSLDGDALQAFLASAEDRPVEAAIPKFESEYETDLAAVLAKLGITAAFDPAADLTGIADGSLYISRSLHKTVIKVGERGTGAAAAGYFQMECIPTEEPEAKTVILDRPFAYLLIDCENNIPFFLGTVMTVE